MWTITEDHLNEGHDDCNRTGTSGGVAPYGTAPTAVTKDTPSAVRFHLLDDDRTPCYSGWLTRNGDWEDAMDYGIYDAGCSIITDGKHHDVIS